MTRTAQHEISEESRQRYIGKRGFATYAVAERDPKALLAAYFWEDLLAVISNDDFFKTREIPFDSYYLGSTGTNIFDWDTHLIIDRERIIALQTVCNLILKASPEEYEIHQKCFNGILVAEDELVDPGDLSCLCHSCSDRHQVLKRRLYLKQQHSLPRNKRDGRVYLMGNSRNRYVKIGFTFGEPKFREKTLQAEDPDVVLICAWRGTMQDEKALHERYADRRLRGEWFSLGWRDVVFLAQEHGIPVPAECQEECIQ